VKYDNVVEWRGVADIIRVCRMTGLERGKAEVPSEPEGRMRLERCRLG